MAKGASKLAGGGGAGGGKSVQPESIDLQKASYTIIDMVINQADSLDELDEIMETIAYNDNITPAQYNTLYDKALKKAQSWSPI